MRLHRKVSRSADCEVCEAGGHWLAYGKQHGTPVLGGSLPQEGLSDACHAVWGSGL